jgi:hypothetical protein
MLGPRIDERHVLARLHHMRAGISADRTRAKDSYLPTHAFLPALLLAEASAPAWFFTTVELCRAGRWSYCIQVASISADRGGADGLT